MRITTFVLTLCVFCAYATDTYSQNARVSISKNVTSLDDILNEIESQTDYLFIYNNQVDVNRSASVKVKNKPVNYVLNNLLADTDIDYSMEGTHIVLTRRESPGVQQNTRTVTGIVTDNNGETIIGANIVEKGTSNGAITDVNGRFTLNVSPGAVLTISFVGYLPQEISVGNQSTLAIELREDTQALDEVVVIGYGSVKKSDLTGSVASVSARSFRDQPITRVEDAIQGRMAGVDVQAISGAPGSEIKIRVRGASSISKSNDPLYVVDGIVSPLGLAGINTADISSIEVLKDASSTAIYGSRGANGVVLITTTRGSSEHRTVTFDSETGFAFVPKKYDLLNAYEYATAYNELRGQTFDAAALEAYKNGTKGLDWQDEIFRTGITQNYKLAISGGNKDMQYIVSGNVLDQTGITETTKFEQYIFRANLTTKVTNWLDLTSDVRLSQSKSHNNNLHTDNKDNVVGVAIAYSPTMELIDPKTGYYATDPYNSILDSPLALLQNTDDQLSNSASGMLDFRFKIAKGLTFSVIAGVNYNDLKAYTLTPISLVTKNNSMSNDDQYRFGWQNTNNLTYTNTWGDHSLTATGVFELAADQYRQIGISGSGLSWEGVGYWNVKLASSRSESNNYSESSLMSWVGRTMYSYKNRYSATLTFRADGSSKFTNNKWGYFPSGALAWNVAEEAFMEDQELFQQLKLRASYGVIGNQAINSYDALGLLESSAYAYGSTNQYTGYTIASLATPDLSWEKTKQSDIGLDLSLLDQRLNITLDWYLKETEDALIRRSIPQYYGGGSYWVNQGKIKNTGIEVAVSGYIFQKKNLTWNSALNFSYMKNEVVNLADDNFLLGPVVAPGLVDEATIIKPGYPIGSIYGLTFLGFDDLGRNVYEDKDGIDGITAADQDIIGKAIPDFVFGWNNMLAYKNWEFNVFFNAALGADKLNLTRWTTTTSGKFFTLRDAYFNGWDKVGPGAEFGTQKNMSGNILPGNTTQWLESADFVKLKNLSIAYTFPKAVTHVADIRLSLSCQNLLTLTSYKGLDPESSSISGSVDTDAGMDLGAYPTPRTYTIGARFTF